jgi:hypothetical protein
MNLYTHQGSYADLTQLAEARLTEIEIFLMFQKLAQYTAPRFNKQNAATFLISVLNPEFKHTEFELDKLRNMLIMSDHLVPDQDELIVYLRFQGIGLNRVTKITKKQHYYQKDLLFDYDPAKLIPILKYDWDWTEKQDIMENSHRVAKELLHTDSVEFYELLDYDFPRPKKRGRFFDI